jgi:hypothetical protein
MYRQSPGLFVCCVLSQALTGCSDSSSTPAAPSVPMLVPRPAVPASPAGYTLTGVSLSGVVSEVSPTGQTPIAGLDVYCEPCGETTHTWATTDANGFYKFSGDLTRGGGVWLSPGVATPICAAKEGYADPPGVLTRCWRDVMITGDTRFDIQLVRR